jgi:hypothetical protein
LECEQFTTSSIFCALLPAACPASLGLSKDGRYASDQLDRRQPRRDALLALMQLAQNGGGIVLYLEQEGRGLGLGQLVNACWNLSSGPRFSWRYR